MLLNGLSYIGSAVKRMINGVRSASFVAILLLAAVTPCIAFQLSAPAPACAQTCATSRGITFLAASADFSKITAADAAAVLGEDSLQKGSGAAFDNFDYDNFWYPVAFARDVPYIKPTKITLFDVDYVISRLPPKSKPKRKQIPGAKADDEEVIYALLDRCPHKSASLSEGRVILPSCSKNSNADEESTTARFQCAYHGWSFDGENGKCLQIPQVIASEGGGGSSSTRSSSQGQASYGRRADTTAVPAMVQQGIIWLFPGGNLEKALLCPPPPRVPELDLPGYRMVPAVRDFPIDWAILLENILDPDHGVFAHQAKPFDMYSASKDSPLTVSEEITHDGRGYTLKSSVDAVDKLLRYDTDRRLGGRTREKSKEDENENKEAEKPLLATSAFYAPTHIVLARRDADGNAISQTIFWVSPTGTGSSRFMSIFVAKMPSWLKVPRWLGHIILNNFLDQDTHLLITAQKYILDAEAKALAAYEKEGDGSGEVAEKGTHARRNLFVYRSPTEKLQARLCAFLDKTLPRVPNRATSLHHLVGTSNMPTPTREFSLDRYEQHTKVCPDSLQVVKNCEKIQSVAKICTVLVLAAKAIVSTYSEPSKWIARIDAVLAPKVIAQFLGLAATASFLANKVRCAFYYNYPARRRDADLEKIPSLWSDTN